METVKTQSELIKKWAEITIENLQEAIDKKGIGFSKELRKSFVFNSIIGLEGNIDRVQIAFNYYGRFVDMGVGRGVHIGQAKENKIQMRLGGLTKKSRKPKKWYSKTAYHEIQRLSELLAENFAIRSVGIAEFMDKTKINIKL